MIQYFRKDKPFEEMPDYFFCYLTNKQFLRVRFKERQIIFDKAVYERITFLSHIILCDLCLYFSSEARLGKVR